MHESTQSARTVLFMVVVRPDNRKINASAANSRLDVSYKQKKNKYHLLFLVLEFMFNEP